MLSGLYSSLVEIERVGGLGGRVGQADRMTDLCLGMSCWGGLWDLPLGCDLSAACVALSASSSR